MGLISRVSSRTYRGKMASRKIVQQSSRTFFSAWKKPFPTGETNMTGLTKIQQENKNNPQGPFCDPFEGSIYKSDYVPTKGQGTKDDPFIIPARNPASMMRSPFSGRYFKLAYDPTDYYGVDKIDTHSHGF